MQALLKGDVILSDTQPTKGETLLIEYDGRFIGTADVSEIKLTDIYREDNTIGGTMVVLELQWDKLSMPSEFSWKRKPATSYQTEF